MLLRLLAGVTLTAAFNFATAQVITTVAGTDFAFPPTPLAAANAPIGLVGGVAADSGGNVYFTSNNLGNNLVFKVDRQGQLTVAAGNGTHGFSGDNGGATSASLASPGGVAVDRSGNLYIADSVNARIRKVTPGGIITTVAGNGKAGYSGDGGPATSAALNLEGYGTLAADAFGNIFIADQGNNVIRKVTAAGIISTVAGNGTAGYSGDGGLATTASLSLNASTYVGIAVDVSGNLFIADYFNNRIRKVTPGGTISTVAGTAAFGFSGDGGPALAAKLNAPSEVAVDTLGNIFIVDTFNVRIRKVTADGVISTVAGNGKEGYAGDGGPALSATFSLMTGVAVDSSGNLFIADSVNQRIRKVSSDGNVSNYAGNGMFRFGGDGGSATSSSLNYPAGVALDTLGDLFIADTFNYRIRQVTPDGTIGTVAGNGAGQFSGDGGPATAASLLFPFEVATDASGNLFIDDNDNDRIREVKSGIISTVAGDGLLAFSGDGGMAVKAALNNPVGLALDASGDLFIADTNNNRVRMVTPLGIISTVAGNGTAGYSGDNGPAISAELNLPTGVAVDAGGNLFIADSGNGVIRKVTPDGLIGTVAGNGSFGFSGDQGPATSAALRLNPLSAFDGIAVDAAGNLFIADYYNNRIRKVTPGGIITTVAGNGVTGYAGDGGPATSAALDSPASVAVDAAGNIFMADTFNHRVRMVLATAPSATVSPTQLTFSAASQGAPTSPQTLSVDSPVQGVSFSASLPDDVNWLRLDPSSGASPRLIQVTADPTGLAPMTYQATITINTPFASPSSTTVAVTFTVTAAVPPALAIDRPSLSFPFPKQGSARSQTITVSDTGSGALQFAVTAATISGGPWLSVSPSNAQALPGSPVTLTVTADPAGLMPGAYSGQVTIVAGAQTLGIPVTMTISALDQAILLSQSGLSFLAVQSGGVVPTQSFAVKNIGVGVVNWTASTSTLAGGPDWLQVTPSAGSSDASASASPRVTVSVDGSKLAAGTYYGLVRVDAPGAANSPQVLTVSLQVLPANANVGGVVQPAQLVFTAAEGGESPGSQIVQIFNIVSNAKSFRSQVAADFGLGLVTLPRDATLDPQQPTNIVVQPFTAALGVGVHNGAVTFQFSDGRVSTVNVTVIVSRTVAARSVASQGAAKSDRPASAGTGCTPTKMIPALTTLGQTFAVSAGWPAALAANVKDDCGSPMPTTGSVTVSFSNGDSPLSLLPQGAATWENTWQTGNATTGVTLTLHADNGQGITGDEVISGNLASEQQAPILSQAGITSAAVAMAYTALAPGQIISIYGDRLAESVAAAKSLPLPQQLVDTQVFVTGSATGLINLPLYYVSQTQVNALVPYEVSLDTSLQLLVQRGTTYSVPVQIDMAEAQPAVFSRGGLPGSPGLIYVYPSSGGTPYFASGSAPAHPGDTIVLYSSGLGSVNPGVMDGAAPGQQFSKTVGTLQLMVGGESAKVSFSGLAPGFAGLYQVNAVLPSGVQTGANVSITLSIDGQMSPPVTISIE